MTPYEGLAPMREGITEPTYRDLETALIHVLEFIPDESACIDCQRVKELAWKLNSKRANELATRTDQH